jgi:hypothetical protein
MSIFKIEVIFEIVIKNTIEAITNSMKKSVKNDEKNEFIKYLSILSI